MKNLWSWIRHNRGTLISTVLISIILLWVYACQSSVRSIVHPERMVNRDDLQAEVDNFIRQAEIKFADLNRQDEIKRTLFEAAITSAKGAPINPIAIALTLGNILGIGAIIDNQRKDVHIKTMKNSNNA